MRALILTNGDYGDYGFCHNDIQYDMIICADNGMKHARRLNLLPHIVVGDFDSCHEGDLEYFREKGVEILKVAVEKDETDTELAIQLAVDKGACFVDVYGGIGSRMDHSIANIQLIYRYMKQGIFMTLYSDKNTVTLIKDKIILKGKSGDLVSLMPFSEETRGVTTKGLAYSVEKGTFRLGDAYGVSNYLLGHEAEISIESGVLLVMRSRD